ncbi:YolD-like family protein [Sporolactobacillus vineae]|uniref:YolD-like family protein n=1 Tax=Sporolactobacillus vineae TaxID=444463 RepID=UPI000287A506|nr:YolD-like family protein [Sporolactobacillus vineae]
MTANKLTKGSNMRWESSRMILPEHVQALRQHLHTLQKTDRPQLDEQEMAEINRMLRIAAEEGRAVTVRYYKDGFIRAVHGHLSLPDIPGEPLRICDPPGISWKIAFRDLIAVQAD